MLAAALVKWGYSGALVRHASLGSPASGDTVLNIQQNEEFLESICTVTLLCLSTAQEFFETNKSREITEDVSENRYRWGYV